MVLNTRDAEVGARPPGTVVSARPSPMRCVLLRSRTPLCVLAALFVASGDRARAGTVQTDFWLAPELAPYRALVDTYREGRVEEAIDGVLAFEVEVIQ